MAEEKQLGITAKKATQFAEWYPEVVVKAELADYSPVKGCMVVRPNAYAIWERIQQYFNPVMKKYGVKNAYFPLFIPESFFKREAEHAVGFTPEVAWVGNKAEGEERLAVRPTSETIIADSFAQWVRSWRDLPLKVNQWANVVRWETKQTRLFLRTREFLWQEGHCIYATEQECVKDVFAIMDEYVKLAKDLLAVPVVTGRKTEKEKFAGAKFTVTFEALMPDGRALQMGTSHNLGQGFMQAFGVKFVGQDKEEHVPWYNSWGISTRLIGAVIMTHSDDKGMVMPPKVAPLQAVIVPILFEKTRDVVLQKAMAVRDSLTKFHSVMVDDRDAYTPGWKFNEWELKGVPLRIEIGPKDVEKEQVVLVRRDNGEKKAVPVKDVHKHVEEALEAMHHNLYAKALKFLNDNTVKAALLSELEDGIKQRKLVLASHCGQAACEDEIKEKADGATTRCIPDSQPSKVSNCVNCGKPGKYEVYFAKAY